METISWFRAFVFAVRPWGKKQVREDGPPLLLMRVMASGFLAALVGIAVVLQFLEFGDAAWDAWHFALLSGGAAVGITGTTAMRRLRLRSVAGAATASEAAQAYQTRMFLGLAFGEIPAMIGFVLAFLVDSRAPYLWMLPLSLLLMVIASPRDADIRNVQRAIDASGGTVNLADALMGRA